MTSCSAEIADPDRGNGATEGSKRPAVAGLWYGEDIGHLHDRPVGDPALRWGQDVFVEASIANHVCQSRRRIFKAFTAEHVRAISKPG